VASNTLSGTVPNLSNMVRLENLQMQDNAFWGTIPEAIQQLQSIGKFGYKRVYRLIIERYAYQTSNFPL
jgi:hypothetical protein